MTINDQVLVCKKGGYAMYILCDYHGITCLSNDECLIITMYFTGKWLLTKEQGYCILFMLSISYIIININKLK